MAMRTVRLNDLEPGSIFSIRGKITYSHITRRIEGEELKKRVEQQRANNNNYPIDKPHTTISLRNATVVYDHTDAYGNPTQKSLNETYAEESLWASRKHPEHGMCYTGYNKGTQLPKVGVATQDNQVNGVNIENELANGLDVTLVMRVFQQKNQINKGTAMEYIIVNEPIRYYEPNGTKQALIDKGIIWNDAPAPAPSQADNHEQPQTNPNQNSNNAAAPDNLPFTGMNRPEPVAPPSGNPYSNNIPNTANTQQNGPINYGQPAQNISPSQPQPYGGRQMTGQNPGQGGICYNPNDRNYS